MKPRLLWALKTRYGYVRDPHYHSPLGTLFFRSRRHAELWLADNTYWLNQNARPVRVNVHITEMGL